MEPEKVTWSDDDEVEGHRLAANGNDDEHVRGTLGADANEDEPEDD